MKALAINPVALMAGRPDIFEECSVEMKDFQDRKYKPILRLPGGDILFCSSDALEQAATGNEIYQYSIHIVGRTIPGACFILGALDSLNLSYSDYRIDPKVVRSLLKSGGHTGKSPRPINDHLFGTSLDYSERGKTKFISEAACGFDVEEEHFPIGYRIRSGRESLTTFVSGSGFDPNATCGYDEGMATYFYQSGLYAEGDDDDDRPLIWLGTRHGEFKNLSELLFAIKRCGVYLLADDWRP